MTAVLNPVELRTGLEGLGEKLNDLRSKSEQTAEVRAEIKQTIEDIRSQDALLCVAERSAEGERRTQSAPQVGTSAFGSEARSAGQQFVDSDGFRDYAQRGAQGQYEGEVRTLLTQGDGTAGGGLFVPRGTPLPPVPNRQRLFVRDLLSVIPTNLLSVPYIRESNNASDDALITGPTAEGSNKPEVAMTFTAQDAPIRTIAGWIPVTRQLLANAPTVSGYIDSRLGYMVQLAEEKQVLNGSGTAPAIRGIRQTTGLQTLTDPSTGAVGVDMIAMLGLAIGKVEAVGGVARRHRDERVRLLDDGHQAQQRHRLVRRELPGRQPVHRRPGQHLGHPHRPYAVDGGHQGPGRLVQARRDPAGERGDHDPRRRPALRLLHREQGRGPRRGERRAGREPAGLLREVDFTDIHP
nr:phage major capsid protein [Fodinicola feengrottensis]